MKRLNFTQKTLDCILILQGKAPDPEIFRLFPDTFLIATDGAANGLIELGIIPHIIIGDLDSFDSTLLPENANSQIIQIVDQEKNDFEKALDYRAKTRIAPRDSLDKVENLPISFIFILVINFLLCNADIIPCFGTMI